MTNTEITWQITTVVPAYNVGDVEEYLMENGCVIEDSFPSDYDTVWIIASLDYDDDPRAIVEWLEINDCIIDEIDAA